LRNFRLKKYLKNLVPERGLEPPLPCENQVLNLARLPIPPFGHKRGTPIAMQQRFAIARVNEAFSFCPPLTSLSTIRRPTAVRQFPIMRLTSATFSRA
jgi:hypothetical protein